MPTSIVWPDILIPAEVAINQRPNNTSGGVSLNGTEQVIGNTPGRWAVTFANIDIRTPEQVLALRSLRAQIRGRLNPLLIPAYDSLQAPSGSIVATAHANVAAGAVSVPIDSNVALTPGQWFEHHGLGERLYEIASVDNISGSTYTCTVWPPVRYAIVAGDAFDFTTPEFRVRLATDNELDLSLNLRKFATITVNFDEAISS